MCCVELNINELDKVTGGLEREYAIPDPVSALIRADAESFRAKGYSKSDTASLLVRKYKAYPVNEVIAIVNSVYG